MLCQMRQPVIKMRIQRGNLIHMIIGPCQNGGAAGRANRIGYIAMIKPHAFICQPIQIRRMIDTAAITADGFGSMIICHDKQDIRLF